MTAVVVAIVGALAAALPFFVSGPRRQLRLLRDEAATYDALPPGPGRAYIERAMNNTAHMYMWDNKDSYERTKFRGLFALIPFVWLASMGALVCFGAAEEVATAVGLPPESESLVYAAGAVMGVPVLALLTYAGFMWWRLYKSAGKAIEESRRILDSDDA